MVFFQIYKFINPITTPKTTAMTEVPMTPAPAITAGGLPTTVPLPSWPSPGATAVDHAAPPPGPATTAVASVVTAGLSPPFQGAVGLEPSPPFTGTVGLEPSPFQPPPGAAGLSPSGVHPPVEG